jgi:hypothetical protein
MKEEIKLFCEKSETCFKINLMAIKKPKPPLKPYPYNYPGIAVNMDVITITKHHGSQVENKLYSRPIFAIYKHHPHQK